VRPKAIWKLLFGWLKPSDFEFLGFSNPIPLVWALSAHKLFNWLNSGTVCSVSTSYLYYSDKEKKNKTAQQKRDTEPGKSSNLLKHAKCFGFFTLLMFALTWIGPNVVNLQQEHIAYPECAMNYNRKLTDRGCEIAQPCGWSTYLAQKPVELGSVWTSSKQFLRQDWGVPWQKFDAYWFPGLHFFMALNRGLKGWTCSSNLKICGLLNRFGKSGTVAMFPDCC